MKIIIDARELRRYDTCSYIERLIFYLQCLDHDNDYAILLKPNDFDGWNHTKMYQIRFKAVYLP